MTSSSETPETGQCPPGRTPGEKCNVIEGDKRSEDIWKELRDKIRGKFQVTTFLAGFGFTILNSHINFLRGNGPDFLAPLSVGVLTSAIILFAFSVYELDRLTLPKMFWAYKKTSECRPAYGPHTSPSEFCPPYMSPSDLWTIKRRMVFYWFFLTCIATFLVFIAILIGFFPIGISDDFYRYSGYIPIKCGLFPTSMVGKFQTTLCLILNFAAIAIIYGLVVVLSARWKFRL